MCVNLTADECEKRHPNPCKFGPRCQFKKENECLYLHDTLASDDQKFEALKANFNSKFSKLENSFTKIQKDLEAKISEINNLKTTNKDLEKLVSQDQFSNLEKDLKDKSAQINSLEMRVEEVEKEHQSYKKIQRSKK